MIGKTISHYKILEKLGEGGMGVVYKAEDIKLKRTVALKFLPPEFTRDQEAKTRFVHEAQAASSLEHNNICNIHEIDETAEGQMFIAMAYYEGQTLKVKIDKGPLKLDEAIDSTIQIAEGLQEAHQNEIIHRDIKSANIMLTGKGQVKILDFGLVKLRGRTKVTKEGTTLGTVAYMSPEQASGEKVDHRSDIWSLGVLLYEMIIGQLPFKGEYDQAIMYAIMNEDPEPITGLRSGVPMELERIINKALSKDPSERYQHADELIVDLKKVKKDSKPEATPAKKKTKPEIHLKISPKFMVFVIFFLVAILVGVLFIFKGPVESQKPPKGPGGNPSIVIPYLENRTGDKNMDFTCESIAELMITDLLQSKHLDVTTSERIYGALKKLKLLKKKKYTFEDLQNISSYLGADYVIPGQLFKLGTIFTISMVIHKADTGEIIKPIKEKAQNESEFNPTIDEITKKIKLVFLTQKEIKGDYDKKVSELTSSNPEALKYYLQGEKAYSRKLDINQAKKLFEKAVELDPDFVMAWKRLAFCHRGDKFWELFLKAFEMSKNEKTSIRTRLEIQAQYYYHRGWAGFGNQNIEKGRRLNEELLELYPGDYWGNWAMGYYYYNHLGDWENEVKHYKLALQAEPENVLILRRLSLGYRLMGFYDKSIKICRDYLKNYPEVLLLYKDITNTYIAMGKFDRALEEAEKGLAKKDSANVHRAINIVKGHIYYLRGDYAAAEKQYLENGAKNWLKLLYFTLGKLNKVKKLINEDNTKISFFNKGLARLYLFGFKNIAAASAVLAKEFTPLPKYNLFMALAEKIEALTIKGLVYLQKNSIPQAERVAGELKNLLNEFPQKESMRFYFYLKGKIELARENYAEAIKYFNQAALSLAYNGIQRGALIVDSLALAYHKSGDLEKAIKEYENITTLTIGRLGGYRWYAVGIIYVKSFYNLGKLYQQKGFKGKAIDAYKKFVDLWKDCDPELQPIVKDAKKRVKELESKK